jgi:hypothetical protein
LKEIKCSGCWDKVFTGGDRFKKSIELEQRRKIVPTTLQLVHHKTSGGTRFCHICSKYFCFCAENSRQRKQSLDLFCYETLEDNEQYSSPINVSIKTINLDNNLLLLLLLCRIGAETEIYLLHHQSVHQVCF